MLIILTECLLLVPRPVSRWPVNTDLAAPLLTLENRKKPQVFMSLIHHSHMKFFVNAVLSRLRWDSFETHLKICCSADGVVTVREAACLLIFQFLSSGYSWLNAQENDISAFTHASTERAGGNMMGVETAGDVCKTPCCTEVYAVADIPSSKRPSSWWPNKLWQMLLNSSSWVKAYKGIN